MSNIIFGVFNGFKTLKTQKGGIYYFMKSLRKYNTSCKVIILVEQHNVFEELQNFAKIINFEIYTEFTAKYNLIYYRFEIYKKYLKENGQSFDKILLSDIDDVIFQDDPFSINFDTDMYLACEKNILSGNNWASHINLSWISECNHLDNIHYENFMDQYIVCAGTILGTYKGIYAYLDFFENIQSTKKVNDQGLLNVYVYNFLESKSIKHYTYSKILTLEGINFDELIIDYNTILNNDGEKYAIIHQIDRCNQTFMLGLVE